MIEGRKDTDSTDRPKEEDNIDMRLRTRIYAEFSIHPVFQGLNICLLFI